MRDACRLSIGNTLLGRDMMCQGKSEAAQARDKDRELELKDYGHCLDGYHARDALVQDQFIKVVRIFTTLAAILGVLCAFGQSFTQTWMFLILVVIFGIAGCFAMVAMIVDMAANSCCKRELLRHCRKIEKKYERLRYVKVINERPRNRIEIIGKDQFTLLGEVRPFSRLLERISRDENASNTPVCFFIVKCLFDLGSLPFRLLLRGLLLLLRGLLLLSRRLPWLYGKLHLLHRKLREARRKQCGMPGSDTQERPPEGSATDLFLLTSVVFLLLWVVFCVCVIYFGPSVKTS